MCFEHELLQVGSRNSGRKCTPEKNSPCISRTCKLRLHVHVCMPWFLRNLQIVLQGSFLMPFICNDGNLVADCSLGSNSLIKQRTRDPDSRSHGFFFQFRVAWPGIAATLPRSQGVGALQWGWEGGRHDQDDHETHTWLHKAFHCAAKKYWMPTRKRECLTNFKTDSRHWFCSTETSSRLERTWQEEEGRFWRVTKLLLLVRVANTI